MAEATKNPKNSKKPAHKTPVATANKPEASALAAKKPAAKAAAKPVEHIDATAGAGTARRNPHLEGLLMVIDFVLAYLFFVSALDTGSLLQYGVAALALILGIRSGITVMKALRQKRGR